MIDIDFASLRLIGLTQAIIGQLHALDVIPDHARLVRVTEVHRDRLTVHDGTAQTSARALPALLQQIATGDWVLCDAGPERWVHTCLAPVTHLARRGGDGRRQAIASNIDTALLVMGLDHDFNLRRLERYLALVQPAGVAPVIVLTKADLQTETAARIEELQHRLPGNLPVFAVNARDAATCVILSPWLAPGQTLVLLGSSGAGKSTLTNTLAGSAQDTGGVREDDSRGRHTTTARSLHLCAGGACIIDTPGLRGLQPDADEEAVAASFEDIDALAQLCQFRDCGHGDEPGCAVRGAVDEDRLRNYHKLLREVRRSQQTPLDRIAARGKWKVLMKAAAVRGRQKRE
jgi:ribosome biogenesis GTPase / thiamine phosphate phosphatase